jgi:LacI family transcriptional regulator
MAMGAFGWLQQAGVQMPEELGMVGFDNLSWARLVTPSLTTVAQPTYDLGRTAAQMLLEREARPAAPVRSLTLPTKLIVRSSSARRA